MKAILKAWVVLVVAGVALAMNGNALYADEVTPLYATHNRVAGNTMTMTNIQAWASSIVAASLTTNDVCAIVTNDIAESSTVVGSHFDTPVIYTYTSESVNYAITNIATRWNGVYWEMHVGGWADSQIYHDGWYKCATTNWNNGEPYSVVNSNLNTDAVTVWIGDKTATGFSQNIGDGLRTYKNGTQSYTVTNSTRNALGLAYYSEITNKQDKLVSGTNIKTVNGNSLLGSGNIEIQGGGGSSVSNVVPLVQDFNGNYTAVTIGDRKAGNVGPYSFVNGSNTRALKQYAHGEGNGTTANGQYSHAEGRNTTAQGDYTHTEGYGSVARGMYSHAQGYKSHTGSGTTAHDYAFCWNGDDTIDSSDSSALYNSHGEGTFNVNPVGGIEGIYVGSETLKVLLKKNYLAGVYSNDEDNVTYFASDNQYNNVTIGSDCFTTIKGDEIYLEQTDKQYGAIHMNGDVTLDGDYAFLTLHNRNDDKDGVINFGIDGVLYSEDEGAKLTFEENYNGKKSTLTPDGSDVLTVNKAANSFLPIGGGTVTGDVVIAKDSGTVLQIGASGKSPDILTIDSYGNLTGSSGNFYFRNNSESPTVQSKLEPDGTDVLTETLGDERYEEKNSSLLVLNGNAVETREGTTIAATHIGAYPNASGTTLANTVNLWENYWGGSNVCWEVTNYYGIVDVPKLRLLELRDGSYREVWNDITKFETFQTNTMAEIVHYCHTNVQPKLDAKADKAWGKYTSAGTSAPSNTVWHTAPTTVFAGGYEYQRFAVGSGSIAVLTANGAPTYTAGEEGKFRIGDDGGTNYFGFAKTDSYTIATRTDGISVSGNSVTLEYDTVGETYPIIYYSDDVQAALWEQLNNPDGTPVSGATYSPTFVTHSTCVTAVINVGSAPKGFFKAESTVQGDAVFETNMKAKFLAGIVCTNTATGVNGVIRPSYNGSTVNWTWSAQ